MSPDQDEIAIQGGETVPDDSLNVQYLGRLRIAVSGRFTGKLYRFSPIQRTQWVNARDAFHLLDSGLFGIDQ